MLSLDLPATERFVKGHPNAFWDGWTMIMFRPSDSGQHNRHGMYRNGQWGIATRVEPDTTGRYRFRA